MSRTERLHEKAMERTTLDPVLPKWTSLATYFGGLKWDLGADMQGYARPDGAEKSMVYNKESGKWEPRPKVSKDDEASGKKSSKRGHSEEGSKSKKGREDDTSKTVKGTIKKAEDVKEDNVEEKAVKRNQPSAGKMVPLKVSSAKGPDTGADKVSEGVNGQLWS